MGSVAAHGDRPEWSRVTVAELLARPRTAVAEPPVPAIVPSWAVRPLTSRQRVTRTAGAVLAIGSIVATAALCGQPEHGPMSTFSGEGGHPRSRPAEAPPEPARVPSERPSRPVATRAPESGVRQPRRVTRPRRPPVVAEPTPPRRTVRQRPADPPAGSALSSLTPPIGPDLVLDAL